MKTIYIKKLRDVKLPSKIEVGDWIDLRAAEATYLHEGESTLIPLGIAMQLPKGYEANIVPRSSTFKKFGIIQTNHYGVVDESYCGNEDEWYFSAYALRNTGIPEGARICQFRINKKMEGIEFIEVKNLGSPNRGGFGSTGDK